MKKGTIPLHIPDLHTELPINHIIIRSNNGLDLNICLMAADQFANIHVKHLVVLHKHGWLSLTSTVDQQLIVHWANTEI